MSSSAEGRTAEPMAVDELARARWSGRVSVSGGVSTGGWLLECHADDLVEVCTSLATDLAMTYGTLVVEETRTACLLQHLFYGGRSPAPVRVQVRLTADERSVPTVSRQVHAADWHEREAEDLFGLVFEGHPRLGDFVLHEHWPDGVNPMRASFDATSSDLVRVSRPAWEPRRLVDADGAFAMPVGPIYSDYAESAVFLLETVGEDVLRMLPRLFYKYRGIEKIAEGRTVSDVLLLAERFSGTSAFAHSLALCRAIEQTAGIEVPVRAQALRVLLAESERVRHHVAVIARLCGSTALAVAANQAAILEEELLRVCCTLTGHRYLFGLNQPGGLALDLGDRQVRRAVDQVNSVCTALRRLRHKLTRTSSFLDRLEEVGVITRGEALAHGLVGPVARASGVDLDLRRALPYGWYRELAPVAVPCEPDGDGYARLRLFFDEVEASLAALQGLASALPPGPVAAASAGLVPGAALAWVEAPGGATFHWVRVDEAGKVVRWRPATPSFANWHGFHLAAEGFAFQDFPIIMASMGLSVAESDR